MQPFEYRSVRYWSKEIDGTLTGGRKRFFFNSRPRTPYGLWRPHQWNPVNVLRCPWGHFGSEYTWLVAYTACARARGIIDQFSHHYRSVNHELLGNGFQSLWGPQESAHAVQATTHYQTYPERPPGADLPPKKVCNLDPMAPRPRKKRQFF